MKKKSKSDLVLNYPVYIAEAGPGLVTFFRKDWGLAEGRCLNRFWWTGTITLWTLSIGCVIWIVLDALSGSIPAGAYILPVLLFIALILTGAGIDISRGSKKEKD